MEEFSLNSTFFLQEHIEKTAKNKKTQNEKYTMFSGNTFYHEKGKAVYRLYKSTENEHFLSLYQKIAIFWIKYGIIKRTS